MNGLDLIPIFVLVVVGTMAINRFQADARRETERAAAEWRRHIEDEQAAARFRARLDQIPDLEP